MTTDSDFIETIAAIPTGDVPGLERLLSDNPGLAASRLGGTARRCTPLDVVSDWPGYFPNGPRTAKMLIDAGAIVDARTDEDHGEMPLHWTASSDDADGASVLLDARADLEVPDGSIGTPLDIAIGFSCWHVARSSSQAAPGSTRSGTPPPSACSHVWKNSSPTTQRSPLRRSLKPSGTRARAGKDVRRNCCSIMAPN